ncbi:Ca-activated chloride channel family protein [Stackebrandtia albiflava]|uniref:Ca-activated chloride channel family protein n=1 Tax=Stackebrandtia albiflava TaxID=406432 RepID=A0A562URS9_9ACTN|nr:von Willebrand factor type A domain-containing protein [Stackebrandtia albiflava]TWJ08308.1 Ca-activated chloride channel family protein [Stackebrandtia albiflava]
MRHRGTAVLLTALGAIVLAGCTGTGSTGGENAAVAPDSTDSAPVPTGEDDESTFAVDIDTASYEYATEQIHNGRLPDPGLVRPEEFVNAFRQDYAEPSDHGFSVTVDGTRTPDWYRPADSPSHLLRVGLQTASESAEDRDDAHLTFVIDASGSMEPENRLPLVKESLHLLIDQLRPGDAVGIVTYSDTAQVVTELTSAEDKAGLHAAVDAIEIGGSTNLAEGLAAGYRVASDGYRADATNRVILLSDGLANTGATEFEPILEQARQEAAEGVALLCVGVGMGYGDQLMEQLADNGDGFAVYFATATRARELFVDQLPATLAVRAKDAKVQVTFDETTVESYRLIGFENRAVADEDFTNDSVDGGEVGPGHSVTALYAVTLHEGAEGPVATAEVRWLHPETGEADTRSGRIEVTTADVAPEAADPRLRVDVVAAGFAEWLRQDERGAELDIRALIAQAEALAVATEDPDVIALAEAMIAAAELAG